MAAESDTPANGGGRQYRFRFDNAVLDEARARLEVDGESVGLEPRPLALLSLLLRAPGQLLSKADLLDRLWQRDEAHVSDNALSNAVSKLRRALGPVAAARIATVAGTGYRFDGPLEQTVLRTSLQERLALRPGQPMPGRESYVLVAQLGESNNFQVWLAEQRQTRDRRVFKFCADSEHLATLKRELSLQRLLQAALPEAPGFVRVLDAPLV